MMFHRHQWVEESRHTTPGVNGFKARRTTIDAIERMAWGITVIVMRCEACGWKKSIEVKGHAKKEPVA